MIKMYGTMICSTTVKADKTLRKNKVEVEYIDVTANMTNMKEFLKLRDTRSEFDQIKANGKAGFPTFLLDDGSILFDVYQLEGVTEKLEEDVEREKQKEIEARAPQCCRF
ncbi:hypothetical protein [Helcococcus kunzii]